MSKTASGQVGPKNPKGGKRIKRGRLHFTEEEVTRQTGAETSEHREIQAGRGTGKTVLPIASGGRGPPGYRP